MYICNLDTCKVRTGSAQATVPCPVRGDYCVSLCLRGQLMALILHRVQPGQSRLLRLTLPARTTHGYRTGSRNNYVYLYINIFVPKVSVPNVSPESQCPESQCLERQCPESHGP